jgi:hypothetical protein
MRVTIPISGPTKQDRAIQANSQMSVNMHPAVRPDGDAKSDLIMYSQPGVSRLGIAGLGPHRCNAVKFLDKLWWVSGGELFSQDSSGTLTSVGTLSTSGTRVVMVAGRLKMMLVDGSHGYYTDGSTVTQITDVDFPDSPTHVEYMDGFFIVNDSDTDDFYINTTSEDPSAWSALDFATASIRPDKTKALAKHSTNLYMLGEDSAQIYFNSGNPDFPFESYPTALDIGISAPYSACSSSYGLFWLGGNSEGDPAVVQASGGQFKIISDDEVTWQISQLSTKSDAIGWVRRYGKDAFYELTFPASLKTFSYHIPTERWCQLKSYGLERFRGAGYGYLGNSAFVGDYQNGAIYKLDPSIYTDDSNAFIRKRVTRVIHKDGLGISFRSLILDAEAGVGLMSGQGSDPQVMMRYSTDGGRTWSSELWRSLGAIGKPETKPTWTNLGSGYDWVFEFSCSDPVKFNLMNLFADIQVGRN